MNKERTKNIEERCRNRSRKLFGSASALFFFFLLLLTNFTKMLSIYEAEPLPSAPSCLFIGNEGRRLNSSLPRRAGYFTPKFSSGPRGLKKPPNDPFTLLLGYYRNMPFGGQARRGSQVRFPKEERCPESPPMFICGKHQKNRRKPVKKNVPSSGVVFTFEEGISTSHVCLKGQQPIF